MHLENCRGTATRGQEVRRRARGASKALHPKDGETGPQTPTRCVLNFTP